MSVTNTHGLGLLGAQAASDPVRAVVEFADGLEYTLAQYGAYIGAILDDVGHGGRGNLATAGDVTDGRHMNRLSMHGLR